jgi:Sigma-70 region 2
MTLGPHAFRRGDTTRQRSAVPGPGGLSGVGVVMPNSNRSLSHRRGCDGHGYDTARRRNVIDGRNDRLVEPFEANRAHLRAVAYRMLGSLGDADDAVQEAWLRLNRADTGSAENPGGWLTTVVPRECLNALRWRRCNARGPLTLACPIRS